MEEHTSSQERSNTAPKQQEGSDRRCDFISSILPNENLRDVAKIVSTMVADPKFLEEFWSDPAGALSKRNISVSPKVCEAVLNADRKIFESLLKDATEVISRGKAFRLPGEQVANVLAAFVAGMLVAEVVHHHLSKDLDFGARIKERTHGIRG